MVYARGIGERELTFDFGEGLLRHNLLMVDRETSSVWSQLDGGAVSGPLQGEPLEVVPARQTTWGFWRRRFPDGEVMVVEGEASRPYYYRDWDPATPRPADLPERHVTVGLGLGLALHGEAHFFPLEQLIRVSSPLVWSSGGRAFTVHHSADGLTAWAEDADGRLLPGVMAYRRGWYDFYPGSREFSVAEEPQ